MYGPGARWSLLAGAGVLKWFQGQAVLLHLVMDTVPALDDKSVDRFADLGVIIAKTAHNTNTTDQVPIDETAKSIHDQLNNNGRQLEIC